MELKSDGLPSMLALMELGRIAKYLCPSLTAINIQGLGRQLLMVLDGEYLLPVADEEGDHVTSMRLTGTMKKAISLMATVWVWTQIT